MLFANVCAGFICCCYEGCGVWHFLAFWVLHGVLCVWRYKLCRFTPSCLQDSGYAGVPIAGHALGGGRWRHYLRDRRGVPWFAQKCASCYHGGGSDSIHAMLYMLALAGPPRALWRNCRQNICETSFSPIRVILLSRDSSFRWCGQVLWHLWIVRARHPGPSTGQLAIEIFNVERWSRTVTWLLRFRLTLLLLLSIAAWVRSEWARLRNQGFATV